MIIDLEKLPGVESVVSGDHRIIYRDFQGEELPIEGHVEAAVRKSGEMYCIHADVHGYLDTFCHKCLEQTKYELTSSFEVIVQISNVLKKEESSLKTDEYITLPKGEHEVSLDGHIYESLIVSIPMRILCRADCKGLCPNCGANLNHETCSCDKTGDPRWDALKKLKDHFSS
jgi:uncharacterized protein